MTNPALYLVTLYKVAVQRPLVAICKLFAITMSVELLQYVPLEDWVKLKSVFKSDWPRSISGFTILDTMEYIHKLGLDYGFKVYCPLGNVMNGIVALNVKPNYYEVVIQCPNDDTSELYEALKQTNLIDWTKSIEVPYSPENVTECVKRIIAEKNLKIDHITMTETFLLDAESPLFDVRLSADYSFKLLPLEYLNIIDSVWPHRYPGSEWYFTLLIKSKLGYGLFMDNELIAWAFVKEMGALGHLYTVEKERRKGYGELVLKLISNVLLNEKKNVVAFCVEGNANAYNLYKKLGFKSVVDVYWSNF